MSGPGNTDVLDLVHCLGYIYLRHGQSYRAVVLLIVAAQMAPDRSDILRSLAASLIASGMGEQALDVITRILRLEPALQHHRMMRLMQARALLAAGRGEEARQIFRSVAPSQVIARQTAAEPQPPPDRAQQKVA
jgi:type III secretion protein Y